MDSPKVPVVSAAAQIAVLLDSPEIAALVFELEATRWTGRPGYPIRAMIGMALAKSLYVIPTWTRTVALASEHHALAAAIAGDGDVPSVYACYRFTAKLRVYKPLLDACISAVLDRLREANPGMGESIAIDGSDLPAYANGQRFVSKNGRERAESEYSDPTHRGAIAPQSRRARAAGTTATRSTLLWTH